MKMLEIKDKVIETKKAIYTLIRFDKTKESVNLQINQKKKKKSHKEEKQHGGVPGWLSQLRVRLLIWAQVMISRPEMGFALSMETA